MSSSMSKGDITQALFLLGLLQLLILIVRLTIVMEGVVGSIFITNGVRLVGKKT